MERGSYPKLQIRGHRQWTPLARALTATGDRWTLLIVLALDHETLRLNALRARLPGVSSGVLDHHLSQMTALGLLSRRRFREMPPRVEVSLTEAGSELLPIAAALARWGMRNEWPTPRGSQRACADAVLRQLPALLEEEHDLPDGILEAIVEANGERVAHRFEVAGGRLHACPGSVAGATTQIEGDEDAWIAALGPTHDRSRLRLAGQRRLAARILDSLPRAHVPAGSVASMRDGKLTLPGKVPGVGSPDAENASRGGGSGGSGQESSTQKRTGHTTGDGSGNPPSAPPDSEPMH
ncbi:MAG TPA: helix-turn-helix domain-containing protein [Solirubrobacteraceae bacterium]|jgi:DNA-binding HxlR family transcriptional regulator|nr:helix-turn-helix domain-containing protein [Solirubrobacteraceae bacterium]